MRENVAYARPAASDEQVAAALEAAAAAGLADEMPDGAHATGQRGRALSGGQRRRVAMARALLQDAPVLRARRADRRAGRRDLARAAAGRCGG